MNGCSERGFRRRDRSPHAGLRGRGDCGVRRRRRGRRRRWGDDRRPRHDVPQAAPGEGADAGQRGPVGDREGRLARDDRGDDAGAGARRHGCSTRPVRGERRRPRDPLPGHGRRQPVCRRGCRGAPRRSPGRVPRARRDDTLGRERRRDRGSARGLPRQARQAAAPERELRRAGRGCVCRARSAHTRTTTRHSRSRVHGQQTGHSASPRPERARGGLAFPRPRLRPEIPLRQAKRR